MTTRPARPRLLRRSTWAEAQYVAAALRTETVGGALLLAAAVVALVWANTPWRETYAALRDTVVGPASLHLDLSLATWAADGALALFFFVAGLELKREVLVGDLRDPGVQLHLRAVDPSLGQGGEPLAEAELVEQGESGGVHGVAAEVAQEVGVLLEDGGLDPGPRHEQAEDQARGAAADDEAGRARVVQHALNSSAPARPREALDRLVAS